MENNKIKVQIEVQEYDENLYIYKGVLIFKNECTVPTSVEETEGEDTYQPDEWVVWSGRYPVIAQVKLRAKDDCFNKECYELKTNNGHNSCSVTYLRKALPHEIPAPEPKLIAKAGEWVKIVEWGDRVSTNTTHGFELNKPYQLAFDLTPKNGFLVESANSITGYNGWDNAFELGMKFEPCPAPRTPIGVYEGVEIFDGDIGYLITYDDMKIDTYVFRKVSFMYINTGDTQFSSKVYLTPEAVNARLLEEVEKKAKQKTFTGEQIDEWMYDTSVGYEFLKYAIELIEKEFNVRYL